MDNTIMTKKYNILMEKIKFAKYCAGKALQSYVYILYYIIINYQT